MNIKPLVDRILVKVEEIKESKGGIVLPDSVQDNEIVYGFVKGLGLPKKDYIVDGSLSIGSRVAFVKYSGVTIMDGQDKYMLVRYDDIIAIVEN